jgi:biotin transport system substrate-specific component
VEQGFVEDYRAKRRAAYSRWQAWTLRHESWVHWATALLFAGIVGALAQIAIHTPLTPVPFTMQVFGVSLMGGLLGRKWGTVSALLYVGLGILGLPMFAGQGEQWDGFHPFGGITLFTSALDSWYIIGFVAQAHIVGAVVDSRRKARNQTLIAFAPLAIAGLLLFALLDVYFLRDYDTLYATQGFRNAWFLLITLGLLLVVASAAWLALTRKARRERVELFFGNIVGLLALYAIGAIGFRILWAVLGNGPLDAPTWLAYTVVPFIPVDLAKILLAVGILTLVRPTNEELAPTKEGGSTHV